jgi:hypothetical protein
MGRVDDILCMVIRQQFKLCSAREGECLSVAKGTTARHDCLLACMLILAAIGNMICVLIVFLLLFPFL